MFQSFTEGELQHVVETLLDRKRRKSLGDNQARRTKRARRPKSCSLRQLELTVTELGFGYESDETVVLRYCSGKCTAHRKNYDLAMKHMMQTGFRLKGRRDKVSNGPCCRPTAFEKNISFLDNKNRYQTLQNVSATNCGCVWPLLSACALESWARKTNCGILTRGSEGRTGVCLRPLAGGLDSFRSVRANRSRRDTENDFLLSFLSV